MVTVQPSFTVVAVLICASILGCIYAHITATRIFTITSLPQSSLTPQQGKMTQTDIAAAFSSATIVSELADSVRKLWCKQQRVEHSINISGSYVPARIVQIGSSNVLSKIELEVLEGILSWLWLHPCYNYVFLDDVAVDNFVGTLSPQIRAAYSRLSNGGERADLVRYLYIYEHGGIYADTDTTAVRAASSWGLGPDDRLVVGLEADFKSEEKAAAWVYARPKSASLHTFAATRHNEALGRVIVHIISNIEHPESVLQSVHARSVGLPSHLETIFKTGPGPFSDVVLSDPRTRVLGLAAFSAGHSRGRRFYELQRRRSRINQTVLVSHANLGSWLKPSPEFRTSSSFDSLRSGSCLFEGGWFASKLGGDTRSDQPKWCVPLKVLNPSQSLGFVNLDQHGRLVVGTGLGPRDPNGRYIASVPAPPPIRSKGTYFISLDDTGKLGLYRHKQLNSQKKEVWKLPVLDNSTLKTTAARGCFELQLVMLPTPTLCVYSCG